jgi:uncharacterized spore protein YtfJ
LYKDRRDFVNIQEILSQAQDSITVKRAFGEPIERDGMTIIPVAKVSGGGGGGGGQDEEGSGGSGVGYGVGTSPMGVYVIRDGKLRWEPAMDLNKVILGGQILVIVALLVLRSILKSRGQNA